MTDAQAEKMLALLSDIARIVVMTDFRVARIERAVGAPPTIIADLSKIIPFGGRVS